MASVTQDSMIGPVTGAGPSGHCEASARVLQDCGGMTVWR